MKQKITAKIKSERGASIVIALICFLVCAMVGSIVLTAASVNAGKSRRDRESYRQSVAVSSAARLLSTEFEGATFTGTYENVTTAVTVLHKADGTLEELPVEISLPALNSELTSLTGNVSVLSAQIFSEFYQILHGISTPEEPHTQYFKLEFDIPDEYGVGRVSGTLKLETNYNITIELYDGNHANKTVLSFTANVTDITTPLSSTTTTSDDGDKTVTTVTTSTRYSTQVTWYKPVITGGNA